MGLCLLACVRWYVVYRGQAQNGELGYGPDGKKSSANPDKVHALEGVETHQVACGIGHTLFLVKPGSKQVCLCLQLAGTLHGVACLVQC